MFKYPENMLIFAAALIWVVIVWRKAASELLLKRTRFATNVMMTRMAGHKPTKRPTYKWLMVLVGLALISIGIMRPLGNMSEEEVFGQGFDVVIALDISKSMSARDIDGNSRLDVAKAILGRMLNGLRDDRIGLVVFAGETMVQSPLSRDKNTFLTFLERVNPALLAKQGTDLAGAILTSVDRFDLTASQSRAIVLVSDGEDKNEKNLKAAIEEVAKKKIPVFTVGIGSEKGSYIPEGQTWFGEMIYKKHQGKLVVTKLDDSVLKRIAKDTQAEYFRASDISGAREVVKRLDGLKRIAVSGGKRQIRVELYWLPVLLAFLLLLIEWMISERIHYEREKDHWLKRI